MTYHFTRRTWNRTEENGHWLSAAAEHSSPMNKARSLKLQLACFLEHVILQDRHHWLPILTNKCMLSYNRLCTMNVEHNTSSQEELRTQNFSYGSCYWRWTVKCLSQLNAPPVSDRDVLRSVIFYFLVYTRSPHFRAVRYRNYVFLWLTMRNATHFYPG